MMLRLFIFVSALMMVYPAFAESRMRVVVPNRDIARGETIGEADGRLLTSRWVGSEVSGSSPAHLILAAPSGN